MFFFSLLNFMYVDIFREYEAMCVGYSRDFILSIIINTFVVCCYFMLWRLGDSPFLTRPSKLTF